MIRISICCFSLITNLCLRYYDTFIIKMSLMTHKFNIYRKDDIKAFEDAIDQKCGGIILK